MSNLELAEQVDANGASASALNPAEYGLQQSRLRRHVDERVRLDRERERLAARERDLRARAALLRRREWKDTLSGALWLAFYGVVMAFIGGAGARPAVAWLNGHGWFGRATAPAQVSAPRR